MSAPLEHSTKSNAKNIWDRTHCTYCQRSIVTPKVSDGLIYPPTFSLSSDEQRLCKTSFPEVVPPYSMPQTVPSINVSAAAGAVCSLDLGPNFQNDRVWQLVALPGTTLPSRLSRSVPVQVTKS